MPRLPRRNEDNFVELKVLRYFTRGNEVTIVDWIKRSTHDADSANSSRQHKLARCFTE